jgi:phosphinothricin acetyltransferase
MIRPVKPEDAESICGIYNYYVENTVITFEEEIVKSEIMRLRIQEVSAHFPWIVWEEEGEILGYAYAHKWHERAAYRFSAEDSIYLKFGASGRGIGEQLLSHLYGELKKADIHVIMSVITLPNEASVGIHEKFGFRKAAQFNEIGFKMGRWLDVGYWELLLP